MERIDLFEKQEILPENVQEILQELSDKYESGDDYPDYSDLDENLEKLEKVGFRYEYYLDAEPFNLCAISFFEKLKKMYRDNLLANPYGEAASADAESKAEASLCQGFYTLITGEVKQITLNDLLGK